MKDHPQHRIQEDYRFSEMDNGEAFAMLALIRKVLRWPANKKDTFLEN